MIWRWIADCLPQQFSKSKTMNGIESRDLGSSEAWSNDSEGLSWSRFDFPFITFHVFGWGSNPQHHEQNRETWQISWNVLENVWNSWKKSSSSSSNLLIRYYQPNLYFSDAPRKKTSNLGWSLGHLRWFHTVQIQDPSILFLSLLAEFPILLQAFVPWQPQASDPSFAWGCRHKSAVALCKGHLGALLPVTMVSQKPKRWRVAKKSCHPNLESLSSNVMKGQNSKKWSLKWSHQISMMQIVCQNSSNSQLTTVKTMTSSTASRSRWKSCKLWRSGLKPEEATAEKNRGEVLM